MFRPAPDSKAKPGTGKLIPWRDFYQGLYAQATGFLGWTPETAWNATPTEIDRAYAAHMDKLKAIHGSADNDQPSDDPREEVSEQEVRAGLAALKRHCR
ncbi:hypothetical protein [Sinorhizobium prairiense]|uniref:hypothetical protein n=2 Tax=Sinorhizobium TaxID=28105 RepID=UPI0023D7E15D|nr:hypothetical protein [Sinorhizobium sp. C101]WEJ38168.1 hypothetical protein N0R80_08775 [Sinorhizobium sp. C101]